ncbi:MAG: alpha/beta hydrolase [Rikenellaceae bacterium]
MNLTKLTVTILATLSLVIAATTTSFAKKSSATPERTRTKYEYKTLDNDKSLSVDVIALEGYEKGKSKNAIVFFFGGGWNGGTIEQFKTQAEYFADLGFVSFLVQYRTKSSDKTAPDVSLMDAKSAIRYIKANAKKFNIKANDLITSGGSAGGHLAAAVSMCPNINDPKDDMSISTTVSVNLLFNPVVCNGPGKSGADKGYGYERVGDYYEDFSPYYNVRKDVPATIFLVGSKDHLIDEEMAYEYQRRIEEVGGRCEVKIYEDQTHGFFNSKEKDKDMTMLANTVNDAFDFLVELRYIKGECKIREWIGKNYPEYKY